VTSAAGSPPDSPPRRDPPARPWLAAAAALAGFVGLAGLKFWPLLRPWERVSLGGDLTLGIEGFFYSQLKRGTLRLWDPTMITGDLTIGGGTHTPFSTPALFHLFYPPGLVVFGLAEHDQHVPHFVLVCFVVAHFVALGAFTALYVRSLGVGRAGAFLAGATVMLSTGYIVHVAHWHMLASLAWLPLALAAVSRLLARPSAASAALAALPLAMGFLAGHPQAFVYVAFAVGLAVAFGLGELVVDRGARAALPEIAALLGTAVFTAALGALLLLPMLEGRVWERQPAELYDFDWKAQGWLPPSQLPKLLLPNAMTLVPGVQHSETALYLGVLPLVLAGLGAALTRARAAWFHAGLAVVALLLAFGTSTPIYRLAYDLVPGLGANRIPGRALLLFTFSVAVLAGYGMDALQRAGEGVGRRAVVRAARLVGRGLAMLGALTGGVLLVRLGALGVTYELEVLLEDLAVLLLLLAASFGVLRLAARRASPRTVTRLALGVALADLLFWGAVFGAGDRSPDAALRDNLDVVALLRAQPSPFRLGLGDTMVIAVPYLYRFGWPVYDEENRLLPLALEDLYFLTRKNPRVLDLLNVTHIVGNRHGTAVTRYATLDVSADVGEKTIPLDGVGPVSTVTLASRMLDAREVPQATPVATITLEGDGGPPTILAVRAGIESAEWAWDHPVERRPAHDRAAIVRSWPVTGHGFSAHDYGVTWRLPRPASPTRARLRYLLPSGTLAVSGLRLDATELATRATRFRPVHRLVEENRDALPRAFFVPRVRVIEDRTQRLALMERFDPEALAILSEPLAPAALAALAGAEPVQPDERVTIVRATWNAVDIRATASRPRLLVVSETWSRWWRATDNGRPVPTLVVDHALRGIVLGPGPHEVAFRFRYPVFDVALVLTLAGWVAVAGVLLWHRRRAARAPVRPTATAGGPLAGARLDSPDASP
jgi:hypothetical protein